MFITILNVLLVFTSNTNALNNEPDSGLNSNDGLVKINKCCPDGYYVGRRKRCIRYHETLSFSTIKVYDEELIDTGKSLEDVLSLNTSKFKDTHFKHDAFDVTMLDYNIYVIETGVLQFEFPNAYNRWTLIAPSNYCVDYRINADPKKIKPGFWVIPTGEDIVKNNTLISISLLSCFFLLLVLVVYSLLPELRNLGGLILMAHVCSLFMSFLLLAIIQIPDHSTTTCIFLTMTTYFFSLATFCWLSVLSFDIWWTFRSYAKAPPIHRRQQYFKFQMYSLFAFGVPFLMTVGLYTLNELKDDLRYLPWFVTPHVPEFGCFREGAEEQLYLHVPMLILVICNCVFYLMTASNIWRLNRGTEVLDAAADGNTQAHRTLKQRLKVYLKLSLVMGLSWLLELVVSISFKYKILWLSDTNNIFVSLAIFLIFVCKKKILKKLCTRYLGRKTMHVCPPAKIESSSKSNTNQESTTYQLKVSSQPHGGNIHTVVSTNVMDTTL